MRPVESPPSAFMVESFTVEHAGHDGMDIRRALGELGCEMPDDGVFVRDPRKAIIKYAPVAHHVGDLIGEICKSKFADPILHPVGMPVFPGISIRDGAVLCMSEAAILFKHRGFPISQIRSPNNHIRWP